MKLLMLHGLNLSEDSLSLFFHGTFDHQAELSHPVEPFLQTLEQYAGPWMPEIVGSQRRRKYSRAAVWKALEEARDPYGSIIGLYRTTPPVVELTLSLGLSQHPPVWRMELNVQPLSFFAEATHCTALVDMVRAWASNSSEEARQAQTRALVHLRPELDFNAVLRTLRERSATLAPVEPRFHPDVAPLLARVVDTVAISQRQRKMAELNAYQPPEPEEWLPADAALPSDVLDVKAACEHYSLLAEHLVALLHTEAPAVFEQTPESLTAVDYQLWHDNFPEVFERHHLDARAVPAVGGYLGQVLVRHLGGEWIPRKKLEEAQVRVGQRVWLPFLRAHRYLRTRQSLLDCSLTQLYREAERHRH